MDRYTTPLNVDDSKTIPYYTTALTTRIGTETVPFYYVTQTGDRLDSLSYRFYRTTNKWWILAKANNRVTGGMAIPDGTKLFIPNV